MEKSALSIDFHEIAELAYGGVGRTALYLGIGLNAALDRDFKKWQLGDVSAIRDMPITYHFFPHDMDDEKLPFVKEQFARWVIGNGLRELIESFELFLDHIHSACLTLTAGKGLPLAGMPNDLQKKFHGTGGVETKLKKLRERFNVGPMLPEHLNTIKSVRNCLTHRAGVVRRRDLNENSSLAIRWNAYVPYLVTAEGESIIEKMPVYVPPFGSVEARRVTREVHFGLGDAVSLTPSQLLEICMFVALCVDEIVLSAAEYARKIGVTVTIDNSKIGTAFDVGKPEPI